MTFISTIVAMVALLCGNAVTVIVGVLHGVIELIAGLIALGIFIWGQVILYTQSALDCSKQYDAVSSLRGVVFFWAIVFYVGFGLTCIIGCFRR